jgi:RNA recognition motif-containing protein
MEPINSNSSCKVFVGNVPFDCTNEEFKNAFLTLEGCENAELVSRNQNSSTRGFGFITFSNSEHVNKFLDKKEKITLKDRTLRFTKYQENNDSDFIIKNLKKNNIFVSNIPSYFNNDLLKKIFSSYGEVLLCYINTDINTGKKMNTGYVEFADENTFKTVLNLKNIKLDDNANLLISRFKEKSANKNTKYDIREIYKVAFNAGRKFATLEKNCDAKN